MVARIGNVPTVTVPTTGGPITKLLPAPTPDISLPPNLNHRPTTADLIIKRTFDGLTPDAAAAKIKGSLQGTVAPQNQALVNNTVNTRVRDMQAALNNVFTPGTPIDQFLRSQLPATINVLGSLSSSTPVVYQVTKPGQKPAYYGTAWGGRFAQLPNPPVQVVMNAQVSLEPRGIKMDYPAWKNPALAGQIGGVVEG